MNFYQRKALAKKYIKQIRRMIALYKSKEEPAK